MIRITTTLSTLALVAALAGSASAAEITVGLTGKDAAAVHADIRKAAQSVCVEDFKSAKVEIQDINSCITLATDDAEAQAKPYLDSLASHQANAGTVTLASAAPASSAK
jgi:hypothetical protein